jgi:HlyD family secretion protein
MTPFHHHISSSHFITTMDRELSTSTIWRERLKSTMKIAVPLAVVSAAAVYGGGLLSPSVEAAKLRTAEVVEGGIEGTVEATGLIVPEFDAVVVCPVEARVLRLRKRAGDSIATGEALLDLDVRGAELALEKLTDNIALKRNAEAQLKATLTAKLQQLENTIRIKRREIESDSNIVEQNRRLFEKGYLSSGDFQKFVIQAKKSADELDALLKDYRNAQISSGLQQEGVALEMSVLQKDKAQSERELLQASTKAERSGVVTWIVQTVGAQIHKGEMVARVADLSSYRVDASVSETQRSRIAVGMPVRVLLNSLNPLNASIGADSGRSKNSGQLNGFVTSVQPTVDNGTVKFTVALEQSAALKPNMRVELGVVSVQVAQTLVVKRGAYFRGEGATTVFVLRNDGATTFAVRTRVEIGTANSQQCEVRSGLQKGDRIVLSDMKDFEHQEKVQVK